jgi:hypothetical protein
VEQRPRLGATEVGILRLLKPRRTLSSVVESLLAGLADGTIVPEPPESKLFPNLARELAREGHVLRDFTVPLPRSWLSESLPKLLERLSRTQVPLGDLAGDLESLIRLTREMRLTPKLSLAQDLVLYSQLIAKQVQQIPTLPDKPELAREAMSDAIRAGRMLEIALEEETPVVEELTFQLQLSLAEVLKTVLQQAASSLQSELSISIMVLLQQSEEFHALQRDIKQMSGRYGPDISELAQIIGHRLEPAISRATNSRIDDAQALILTLQMALKRAQTTIAVRSVTAQDRAISAG